MSSPTHQLIKASAGTGKTYRLTNQFLGLLFRGVDPDRILATTFTRKAAGEILDRVLQRLVDGAEDPEKCRELGEALELPRLSMAECRGLLARLTKNIDSFQVRTIDSFFLSMVQLFALDLGLPPKWSISKARLDERIQSEALQDALSKSSTAEMLELLRDLNQGKASRNVHRFLMERAGSLRPIFLESTDQAWETIKPTADVSDDVFEAALLAHEVCELPQTQAGTPNKNFQKSWIKLGELARSGEWNLIFEVGLIKKFTSGEDKFNGVEITEAYLNVIEPIMQRAGHFWLRELELRNLATRSLLEHFESAYEERKRNYGAYRFDDLPLALSPRSSRNLPLDERELDIWFRMDGRVDHLLLDEFQDTSPIQWRILKNLVEEIVADGTGDRTFFCVGDVKQSIYSFRQAEPRLLGELHTLLPGLEPKHMEKSFRSSQVVLETVNWVFADMAGNPSFGGDQLEPYRQAATKWQAGFAAHEASDDKPGAAVIYEARKKTDEEQKFENLIELTVERVVALSEKAPRTEIGILTRVRKHIPTLIHRLKQRGIYASGEGGNELVDSPAVLAYVSLLHLADHPGDSAALFHIATSRFGEYVGLKEGASDAERCAFASAFRRKLTEQGLGRVTSELAEKVAADEAWSDWDQTRFTQLLDMAFAFESELGLRASDFVENLRNERVEAPGGARVRVMTVHASKGLEFDCVLLPDLDRKFVNMRDKTLTERPQPDGLIKSVTISPRSSLLGVHAELKRLYDDTTERIVGDGLSNLYVAMTRAARRLELLIPNRLDSGKRSTPTFADFILDAIPSVQDSDDERGGLIWEHSDNSDEWCRSADPEGAESEQNSVAVTDLGLAPSHKLRSLPRRSPSGEEGGTTVRANRLLAPGRASRRGSLVHAWLEELEWIDDFAIDRERFLESGRSLEPDLALREAALGDLERALKYEPIRAALARDAASPAEADRLEVHNEYRFSVILPGDEQAEAGDSQAEEDPLWSGSIDRLVLAYRGDEVIGATVIDYKTDRVSESDLAERSEFYAPQLRSYARVVAAQTGLEVGAISKQLLFLTPGRTMAVE